MNKDCPLKLLQCGDHCEYFRVLKVGPEALRIVGCVFRIRCVFKKEPKKEG